MLFSSKNSFCEVSKNTPKSYGTGLSPPPTESVHRNITFFFVMASLSSPLRQRQGTWWTFYRMHQSLWSKGSPWHKLYFIDTKNCPQQTATLHTFYWTQYTAYFTGHMMDFFNMGCSAFCDHNSVTLTVDNTLLTAHCVLDLLHCTLHSTLFTIQRMDFL